MFGLHISPLTYSCIISSNIYMSLFTKGEEFLSLALIFVYVFLVQISSHCKYFLIKAIEYRTFTTVTGILYELCSNYVNGIKMYMSQGSHVSHMPHVLHILT